MTGPSSDPERAMLLEELYEQAPCAYLSTRPDGTITRVNRTFETWTGHTRDEVVGRRRLVDLMSPGGRIYHETHFAPLLQMQGSVRGIAVEVVRADGTKLPVLINSDLRRDVAGAPLEVRTTIFDATERRHYERELLAARRRAEVLQRHSGLLADVGGALDGAHGVQERAQRLVDLLVPRLAATAVVLDAEARSVLAAAGAAPQDEALHAALRDTLRTAESRRLGSAVAAVPLLVGSRLLGALGILSPATVDGIDDDVLAALTDVGSRAALALENARLYEYQRDVAHTLQRSMLSDELPRHPRCAIGTHYAPAVATLEVGGDWHDAFFLAPDRVALVVGDVVGRGLEAASMMGQLRSAVRALAVAELGPAAVLENLDRFAAHTPLAQGATIAYAELDLETGRLALACAGHPPPILVRPGQDAEILWIGRSGPLGAYSGPTTRSAGEVLLERGARLLLYTDGLVERRDRPLDVGIADLQRAFAEAEDVRITDLGTVLAGRLLAPGAVHDDMCTLALSFGSTTPFERRVPADLHRLRDLRAELRSWLEAGEVGGEDRDAIVLACSETAANAIEHGYRGADGEVLVHADGAPGEITLEVTDRGGWRAPVRDTARGRGLLIVEHLMDEVRLERGRGTRVTMRRRLRSAEAS